MINPFIVYTSCGKFRSKALLVATGGLSYKKIGASGISFKIARKFGHKVSTLAPALVGLTLQKELFFAGEVCDATGKLGGFNIKWAFSSGFVAAKGIDAYLQ